MMRVCRDIMCVNKCILRSFYVGRSNFEKRRVLATMRQLKIYNKTISVLCLLIMYTFGLTNYFVPCFHEDKKQASRLKELLAPPLKGFHQNISQKKRKKNRKRERMK